MEGHAIIQRLNDAFDAKWSFEILKHEVLEDKDEVIVQGKLAAENVINEIRGVAPTNSTCRSCFVDRGFCVAVANQKDPGYACGWMLGIYRTFSVAL